MRVAGLAVAMLVPSPMACAVEGTLEYNFSYDKRSVISRNSPKSVAKNRGSFNRGKKTCGWPERYEKRAVDPDLGAPSRKKFGRLILPTFERPRDQFQ